MLLSEIPKTAGIYKLTNRINDKIYIGKSINLYNRMITHKSNKARYCIDFAIKKYSWENFKIEILAEFDKINNIELLALETAFIEYFESLTTQNGYNVCLFGNDNVGIKRTEEMKKRYSLSKMGNKNPNYGKTWSGRCNFKGQKNPKFDYNIYTFKNILTNEIFIGYRYDFRQKYNLSKNVDALIRGKDKSVKNWILIS
jgi:group I intron endonuclease